MHNPLFLSDRSEMCKYIFREAVVLWKQFNTAGYGLLDEQSCQDLLTRDQDRVA